MYFQHLFGKSLFSFLLKSMLKIYLYFEKVKKKKSEFIKSCILKLKTKS